MDSLAAVTVFFLLWVSGFALMGRVALPNSRRKPEAQPVRVSVVIPARDEAANLSALLDSLRYQPHPPDEVIVVDDHSSDATSTIAQQGGAMVLASRDLPPGWRGKPWACWQGAQQAGGEVLLFLDADTRLEPEGLQRLLSTYAELGGLLSLQPYHRMVEPYEQLAAFFNLISLASLGSFGLFGFRRKPSAAFGPANLCSRHHYFAAGGHSCAPAAVAEGFPLGQAFLAAGFPLNCLAGEGAVSYRMYQGGVRSLVDGFGKSFAFSAQGLPPAVLLLISLWIGAGIEPLRHLLVALQTGISSNALVWMACYLLYAAQLRWMLRHVGNFRWQTALAYPLPLAFFIYVFFRSCLAAFIFKKVKWKGRVIDT